MRDLDRFEVLAIAKSVAMEVYRLTAALPKSEMFGLSSQVRRAAVSIAANVAEGLGRGTQGDFERHLRIALGSAAELHVLVDLASALYPLDVALLSSARELVDEVRRKLTRLTVQVARARQVST